MSILTSPTLRNQIDFRHGQSFGEAQLKFSAQMWHHVNKSTLVSVFRGTCSLIRAFFLGGKT